jgi:hypothetical protein
MLKMHTERCVSLCRKELLLLHDFNQKWNVSTNFMKIHLAIKWLKSKQTYRHSETNINISATFNAHVAKNKY